MGLVQITAIPEDIIKPYLDTKNAQIEPLRLEYENTRSKARLDVANLEKANTRIYAGTGSQNEVDSSLQQAQKSRDKMFSALEKLNQASLPESYLANLPQSIITTTTDADGKFILKFPKAGKYAIAARAERKILDKTEEYFWLIWVNVDGSESKNIMLSNNNLTDSGSPDSIIKTTKYELATR